MADPSISGKLRTETEGRKAKGADGLGSHPLRQSLISFRSSNDLIRLTRTLALPC